MKLHPRVSAQAVELVKRFEGLRRTAAELPDGGWTVGYGHTRSAREGAVVTAADAEALLYYDLSEVAQKIDAWTFTPLNQNQFEALVAFAFNIGLDNFRRSTVLKRVNEGQHLLAAAAFELWRKADFNGENLVIDALVRRRAAEKSHYLTPPEGYRPSPSPVLRPTFDHSVIEAAANARACRAATVVDAPLEGDATPMAEPLPVAAPVAPAAPEPASVAADGPETAEVIVPAAASMAASVSTARLLQLFPDRFAERMGAAAPERAPEPFPPVEPFSLSGDHGAQEPHPAMNDVSSEMEAEAVVEPAPQARPPLEVPPAPKSDPGRFAVGFGAFEPPPVRRFAAPPPFPAAEPPPVSDTFPEVEPASLFDAPSARAPFPAAESFEAHRFEHDPFTPSSAPEPIRHVILNDAEVLNTPTGPLHDRSMIYFAVGLLGVALFAAALFSMFSGKASPVNLVIGLMGILLITPAGGYFLLRFLNRRDEVVQF